MRFLADENIPKPTVQALRHDGHDVLWARTDCPSERDSLLLDFAETEGRIVLTLDKDFWQIALQRRQLLLKAGVVLLRVHPAVPDAVTSLVRRALASDREWIGHVSVVTVQGIEMFPSQTG
jgi:predicted nuclease of predicted toxin-antitoxin system